MAVGDRYQALVEAAEQFVARDIDADEFEDRARLLTDSNGYKLYNLKRLLSKVEKQVVALLEEDVAMDGGKYSVDWRDDTVTLVQIERPHIAASEEEE